MFFQHGGHITKDQGSRVPLWEMDSESDPGQVYADLLVNTYGASEVWRLTDIKIGTTILAQVNTARNGMESGWTLQSAAGPVTDETLKAPLNDGSTGYGDIMSASLVSLHDSTEQSYFVWAKVSGAGVWTDGITRRFFILSAADVADGYVLVTKPTNNNSIRFNAGLSGISVKTIDVAYSGTGWLSLGVSISKTNNETIFALNGVQINTPTDTYPGDWADALALALIGANSDTPTNSWSGLQAYMATKQGTSVWSAADFAAMHAGIA